MEIVRRIRLRRATGAIREEHAWNCMANTHSLTALTAQFIVTRNRNRCSIIVEVTPCQPPA